MKFTDPTGHMQVCDQGDEGEEGILHSSSCGSGANMDQIGKAFDKDHGGKGYSEYYQKIHGVKQNLDEYIKNWKTQDESETHAMYQNRIKRSEYVLQASIDDARITGQKLNMLLKQDAWKAETKFPEILGGGYIVDNGSASLGGDSVGGSGEFSSGLISKIVSYYMRTPLPRFLPGDDWMFNP